MKFVTEMRQAIVAARLVGIQQVLIFYAPDEMWSPLMQAHLILQAHKTEGTEQVLIFYFLDEIWRTLTLSTSDHTGA